MRSDRRRAALAFVVSAALVAAIPGCAAAPAGSSIVRYERGAAAYRVKAPQATEYALYAGDDPAPRMTVRLETGAMIGFERDAENRLVAVAGDRKVVVPDGSYTWRRL